VDLGAGPSLDPRELDLVRCGIDLNRQVILDYWNGDLLTDEAVAKLQAVR
jgi:hypothetical protein